eukprot:TRINITY_DN89399_c0_g1_i1.p1 TRINITY_DN89399_c0_g1~~TRINITY_DN89399_c0_g1_i1.p1  ORF type:complete len:735 (+),score=105.65 TRINITY_DN89399_c0_g1_i1:68-2272(+)
MRERAMRHAGHGWDARRAARLVTVAASALCFASTSSYFAPFASAKESQLLGRARQRKFRICRSAVKGASSPLVQVTNVRGTHDDIRTLFQIRDLTIEPGQKVAVVGSNGCGKSTLLGMLSGKSKPPEGEVQIRQGAHVSVVEQSAQYDPEKTVLETIYTQATSAQAKASRRYSNAMVLNNPDELEAALEEMEQTPGAWEWDSQVNDVIDQLGLAKLKSRSVADLSGGELRRVSLASALVDLPTTDLLILDEPTNHLSAEGCEYLQQLLNASSTLSLVLVSHDRYFLDQICNKMLEIDPSGETFEHPGKWEEFLKRRAKRYELKANMVADAKVQLRRAEAWAARGARGRGTKAKARIQMVNDVRDRASAVVASDDGSPDLQNQWISGKALKKSGEFSTVGLVSLRNVTVNVPGRGTVLDKISFDFTNGMKIGIVGPNGAGKSTLIKSITGDLPIASGEIFIGEGILIGHLSQDPPEWPDPTRRVMQVVSDFATVAMTQAEDWLVSGGEGLSPERRTAQLLRAVNFDQQRWMTPVGMLSGGENRRLQLLRVLSQRPNFLLLDEPTNDLDAVTVDALEQMLQSFPGTVLLVSHDRSLLDGVCTMHLVMSSDGTQPMLWAGSHADLREMQKDPEKHKSSEKEKKSSDKEDISTVSKDSTAKKTKRGKRSAPLPLMIQQAEAEVERVDARIAKVDKELEVSFNDPDKLETLVVQRQKLESAQTKAYQTWEDLLAEADEN